jgi:flavin reductase (DIM6/NTAB) family NADH-FMN oxidoreductase RutF
MSPDEFFEGMRRLGAAVTVITTSDGTTRGGLTASAVTSLTGEPPTLLACVNRTAGTHELIVGAGRFCVNVLPQSAQQVAEVFAGMTGEHGEERFATGEWRLGEIDQPVLTDALVAFECVVESFVTRGTHDIVIGEARAVHTGPEADPLLYMDRKFGTFAG